MAFVASKIFWTLAQPSSLALLLLTAGLLLLPVRYLQRLARRMARTGAALLALGAFLPFGHWLLAPLEERFPPRPAVERVDGILLLGGSFRLGVAADRGAVQLNDAAERVTETIALARRYPDAQVLFTGGVGALNPGRLTEADQAARLLADLGLPPERLVVEGKSRNTYENAVLTRALADPKPGQTWLLVTSAAHMPRAVGVFRAAGFPVVPWPVDYETGTDEADAWSFAPLGNLRKLDQAAHEWIGLLAYRLLGWSATFFPDD